MYIITMDEIQRDAFTHPRVFVAVCDLSILEKTIRQHGYIGSYKAKEVDAIYEVKER